MEDKGNFFQISQIDHFFSCKIISVSSFNDKKKKKIHTHFDSRRCSVHSKMMELEIMVMEEEMELREHMGQFSID